MSASLVGSEMCIRDSFSASPAVSQPSTVLPSTEAGRASPSNPRSAMWGSCLLYTSDAADDM
eukprot:7934985-Alexandrium_andersonii.AAC.1